MELGDILDNDFTPKPRNRTPVYTLQLKNVLKIRRAIRAIIEGQDSGIIHPEIAEKVITKIMEHYLDTGEVIKLTRKSYI